MNTDDNLSDKEKKLITNYQKLLNAENKIVIEIAKYQSVIDLINLIPDPVTLSASSKIIEAEEAYEKLEAKLNTTSFIRETITVIGSTAETTVKLAQAGFVFPQGSLCQIYTICTDKGQVDGVIGYYMKLT